MYLAVDIGGTKTLLSSLDEGGKISQQFRFATPSDYKEFLKVFRDSYRQFGHTDFKAGAVAVPGRIDREHGRAIGYGSLKWGIAPIEHDIEAISKCPIVIENDAKLAGLSEAQLIKNEFKRVLYVTIGTGIGDAVIFNGVLDPAMIDSEGGQIWLEYHGKKVQWEDIASGKAIFKKYGKRAKDIHESKIWEDYAQNLALGLVQLIAIIEPEVIVLGGGIGSYYHRYAESLKNILMQYSTPLTPVPALRQAQRPEEAVIYGCYELIKQTHGKHTA